MSGAAYCPVGKAEKLLLASDGTEHSEGAIREAISFAKKCSSQLYAMSVIEHEMEYESIAQKHAELEEAERRKHLDSVKIRAQNEGISCETFICTDNSPDKCIVEEAEKRNVDMIITGKRGAKGLMKLMMGEVVAKLIGRAPCKVLVVPKDASISYSRILVATDGSKHSNAAVEDAIEIAKRCGGHILAVSAMRDQSEQQEATSNVNKVIELAKKAGVSVEALTPTGRSFNVIVDTAGGRAVDLIVMGTYGKTGLEKILMGSSTEKVIGLSKCAVLVVKASK
jgi:nucleotide-binding universal stress UspA family protein